MTMTVIKTGRQWLHLYLHGDDSTRSLDCRLNSAAVNAHNCRHPTQISKYDTTTSLACMRVTQLV